MVNNNNNLLIENKKPFAEVQYLDERVQLPSVEEIKKHGLSAELRKQLLNPQAKFDGDLVVMPVVTSTDLMIAGSQSIMSRIKRDFPNVARVLDWNPDVTLSFLKEKSAFSAYLGSNAFYVPCSHTDNYSKSGPAAWSEYKRRINEYVSKLCQEKLSQHYEELLPARENLSDYIWCEYYKVLPYWPSVGETNTRSIEVDTGSSYEHGRFQVVWNCLGWITVEDKRPAYDVFQASFRGSPEIKLMILNLLRLRQIEQKCESEGIEPLKSYLRNNQSRYRQISWAEF